MLEITRINGSNDCFELECLEREATPEPAMKLGIHLAEKSIWNTVLIIYILGVERC